MAERLTSSEDIQPQGTDSGLSSDVNVLIQNNLARTDSKIWITQELVYKALNWNELVAYTLLQRHQAELNNLGVKIPKIVGITTPDNVRDMGFSQMDNERGICIMQRLSDIEPVNLLKFFGVGIDYDEEDYLFLFSALDGIRRELGKEDFADFERYTNQVDYLKKRQDVVRQAFDLDHDAALESVQIAFNTLSEATPYAAHRDVNFGNFAISGNNGKKELQIIDFETFGQEYPGYDEGRLLIHLSYNPANRDVYVAAYNKYCKDKFLSKPGEERNRKLSFLSTAIIRGYAELAYFKSGFYDSRLRYNFNDQSDLYKASIQEGITEVIDSSVSNLKDLVGENT